MAIDVFERNTTTQFTFVSSIAPDSAPIFKVTGVAGTVVDSITSVQSDTTHFYALYTMPTSDGVYVGEWYALKTFASSVRTFIKKDLFQVNQTTAP